MLIHLIRHTTPDINKSICYGQADIGLCESFEQEKDIILSKARDHYNALYTSPLSRCKRLSESIKADTHDGLLEYNFGDWELKP